MADRELVLLLNAKISWMYPPNSIEEEAQRIQTNLTVNRLLNELEPQIKEMLLDKIVQATNK